MTDSPSLVMITRDESENFVRLTLGTAESHVDCSFLLFAGVPRRADAGGLVNKPNDALQSEVQAFVDALENDEVRSANLSLGGINYDVPGLTLRKNGDKLVVELYFTVQLSVVLPGKSWQYAQGMKALDVALREVDVSQLSIVSSARVDQVRETLFGLPPLGTVVAES